MYVIEKNYPLPKMLENGGRRKLYPFAQMEVGDSFFVPNTTTSRMSGIGHYYGKKLNRRFINRSENGGSRVWRVE